MRGLFAALLLVGLCTASALADRRTSVVFTAPLPFTAPVTANTPNLGLSYDLVKPGLVGFGPYVTVGNFQAVAGNYHALRVQAGALVAFNVGHFEVGVGEAYTFGALPLKAASYQTQAVIGYRF